MTDTTLPGLLLTGTHAGRPAATTVGGGTLYAETDTGQIYQSDGSTWSAWGAAAVPAGAVTTSGLTMATARLLGRTTASTGAIEEITVGSGLSLSAGSLTATGGSGITKVPVAFYRRTAGDYTLNNNSAFAAIDATNMKLTIAAATSDVLQISLLSRYDNAAVNAFIDVATIVSAAPVNYVSGGTGLSTEFGIAGWVGLSGTQQSFGGPVFYTVQAGDISGGNVVLETYYRTSAATNRGLRAGTSANDALFFGVINLLH